MTIYLPQRFLVRPAYIDAMQYTAATCVYLHRWVDEPHPEGEADEMCGAPVVLHGEILVENGDWVCRDDDGFYVVSHERFRHHYFTTRRRWPLRRWVVVGFAAQPNGRVLAHTVMSRHVLLSNARRAVRRYEVMDNPNDAIVITYGVYHVDELPMS